MPARRTVVDTRFHTLLDPRRATPADAQKYLDDRRAEGLEFLTITPTGLAFFRDTRDPSEVNNPAADPAEPSPPRVLTE